MGTDNHRPFPASNGDRTNSPFVSRIAYGAFLIFRYPLPLGVGGTGAYLQILLAPFKFNVI